MDRNDWITLPRLPVPDLVRVRDLIYFDGPLLSEFRSSNGDTYLFHWCDVEDGVNRWMVFRVSRSELVKYMYRRLSLRKLICDSQDGFAYIVDIGANNERKHVFWAPFDAIPDDYLPEPTSMLVFDPQRDSSHSYAVLIDQEWDVDDLAQFPRRYTDVYTFLYTLGDSARKPPTNTHMFRYDFERGRGYASRHFFRELQQQIPRPDRPGVDEIRYASPGFISLRMNPELGPTITAAVARYVDDRDTIMESYKILAEFVRVRSVPDDDEDDDFVLHVLVAPFESDADYVVVARELCRRLGYVDWQRLYQACENDIKAAARILLIYCRRLGALATYQASGKAELL